MWNVAVKEKAYSTLSVSAPTLQKEESLKLSPSKKSTFKMNGVDYEGGTPE